MLKMEPVEVKINDSQDKAKNREKEWSEEIIRENEKKNFVASLISFVGWVTIGLSLIIGLVIMFGNGPAGITPILYGVVSGLLFVGFAEVINLLQKIYINTRK